MTKEMRFHSHPTCVEILAKEDFALLWFIYMSTKKASAMQRVKKVFILNNIKEFLGFNRSEIPSAHAVEVYQQQRNFRI